MARIGLNFASCPLLYPVFSWLIYIFGVNLLQGFARLNNMVSRQCPSTKKHLWALFHYLNGRQSHWGHFHGLNQTGMAHGVWAIPAAHYAKYCYLLKPITIRNQTI